MTMTLQELSERISSATEPGNVLDITIAEYLGLRLIKTKVLGTWRDNAPPYTTDVAFALKLTDMVPGLAIMLLKHPNGMWSLAASDDDVPQFDGSLFEEQYLALSIVATVFETLVDRAARQQ